MDRRLQDILARIERARAVPTDAQTNSASDHWWLRRATKAEG
jgi:hypothetical protein